MSNETDREALAGIIRAVTDLWDEPLDEVHDVPQILNAILTSGWLAADRAATRRQALDEAVEAIRAERPSTDVNRLRLSPHHREDELGKLAARRALNDASDVVANLRDGGEE